MKDLLPFCKSDIQRKQLKTYIEHGSYRVASAELGINTRTLQRSIKLIQKNAAKQGFSPEHDMNHAVPEGFGVKGVSTYYDNAGQVKGQWVKSYIDKDAQAKALIESLIGVFDDYKGKSHKVKTPKHIDDDRLAVYPMGDPHVGMYAYADEAGDDFDCDIASKDLRAAVSELVSRSPACKTAIILNLGDYFHSDNMDNRTSRSGHTLDVDTRWARVLRIGVDLLIECVYCALKKHENVIVKNVTGNHDDHSSIFLAVALDKYFHNEPRVTIDQSPSRIWYYRFGKVLIGSTHGDATKPEQLPSIMAADRHKDWGDTEFRYWYTGHIHSKNAMEFPGVMWESFRTLAAKDAWHAGMGYRSGRDMQCIIHHKDFGEIGRNTANIAMIRSAT